MGEGSPVVSRWIHDPVALAAAVHNATFMPCQLSVGPSASRLTRVMGPAVCLDVLSLGPAMLFTGAMPQGHYTLIFVTACAQKGRAFNFAIEHNDGYMGFFPPGGILDAYTPPGYGNATLTVPADVFEAAVARLFPEMPERILKHGAGMPIGELEQYRLRGLLKAVMQAVQDPSQPLLGAAARGQLELELLEVFIAALRSGCQCPTPRPKLRIARRLARLKQAREFLIDHLHEPLPLAALCQETGMSRRGLELLFQDSMGIGPNALLRHQRLHHTRRALQSAPQAAGMVKQIALACGFWHMGHFAHDYRGLFGESPSDTLAKRPTSRSGRQP